MKIGWREKQKLPMEEMNTGTRMEATDFDIYDIDMMNLKPIYW